MAFNAAARSRLSEEERRKALTSGPYAAAREKGEGRAPTGGPYCAVRGGRGRRAGCPRGAGYATRPRARRGRGRGAGPTTVQGQG